MIEFTPWPKTPRLFRECTITEKLDGTNAAIHIEADGSFVRVVAQSRKRLITPADDNFGFAAWVAEHADALAATLGEGTHFGEWWGRGIQRGYGLSERRFSLFNTERWSRSGVLPEDTVPGLGVVPTLFRGNLSLTQVYHALSRLKIYGSVAAPGFKRPEGIVVYHHAAAMSFKATLENDDAPKGRA